MRDNYVYLTSENMVGLFGMTGPVFQVSQAHRENFIMYSALYNCSKTAMKSFNDFRFWMVSSGCINLMNNTAAVIYCGNRIK